MMTDTPTVMQFDRLADALRATRNTNLVIIDGPAKNFAVVNVRTAAEIWNCPEEDVFKSGYVFWSIGDAEAYDAERRN